MSEKRDPRSFLASVLVQSGYSHSTAEGMVQRALDVHAHELAQKIRSLRDSCAYETDSPEYKHMSGSADLIDPGDAA